MLKIRFIVVGRSRSSFLQEGESFYMDRIGRYARIQWVEVKPAKLKKGRSPEKLLAQEGDAIAKRLLPRDYVIALDRRGKAYDSERLAAHMDQLSIGHQQLVFVIGGPLGLPQGILNQAGEVISLSPLTLTHEMCRLVLLEQVYRAFTIINGEPYHK